MVASLTLLESDREQEINVIHGSVSYHFTWSYIRISPTLFWLVMQPQDLAGRQWFHAVCAHDPLAVLVAIYTMRLLTVVPLLLLQRFVLTGSAILW